MSVRNQKAQNIVGNITDQRHLNNQVGASGISDFVRELYKGAQFWGPNDPDFQEQARARAMKEAEFVKSLIGEEGLKQVYNTADLSKFGFDDNRFPTDTSSVHLIANVLKESMAHGNFSLEEAKSLLAGGNWAQVLSNYYNNEVLDQHNDDELVATTLAMGEEGDGQRDDLRPIIDPLPPVLIEDRLTTLAIGEEGDSHKVDFRPIGDPLPPVRDNGISDFVRELYKDAQFWGPINDPDFQEQARSRAMKEAEFVKSLIGEEGLKQVYNTADLSKFGFDDNRFPTDTSSVSLIAGVLKQSMAHGNFSLEEAKSLLAGGNWAQVLSNYYNNEVLDQHNDDEIVATTLAMGEEDSSLPPVFDDERLTTLAMGEEGDGPRIELRPVIDPLPPVLIEERLTTLAMGEESESLPPVRDNSISDFVRELYKDAHFWGPANDPDFQDHARQRAMVEAEFVKGLIGEEGLKQVYNSSDLSKLGFDVSLMPSDVSSVHMIANILRASVAQGGFADSESLKALTTGNWAEVLSNYYNNEVLDQNNDDELVSTTLAMGEEDSSLPPVFDDERLTTLAMGEESDSLPPVRDNSISDFVRELYKNAQFWGPNDPDFQEQARDRVMKEAEFVKSLIGEEGLKQVYSSSNISDFGFDDSLMPSDVSSVHMIANILRASVAQGGFADSESLKALTTGNWAEILSNYYNNEVLDQNNDDELVSTTLAMGEEGDSIRPQDPVSITLAIGENGEPLQNQDRVSVTLAVGENGEGNLNRDQIVNQIHTVLREQQLDNLNRFNNQVSQTDRTNLITDARNLVDTRNQIDSRNHVDDHNHIDSRNNVDTRNQVDIRNLVDDRNQYSVTLAIGENGEPLQNQDRVSVTLAVGEDGDGNLNRNHLHDNIQTVLREQHLDNSNRYIDQVSQLVRSNPIPDDRSHLIADVRNLIDTRNQIDNRTQVDDHNQNAFRHHFDDRNQGDNRNLVDDRNQFSVTLAIGENGDSHPPQDRVAVTLAIGEDGSINHTDHNLPTTLQQAVNVIGDFRAQHLDRHHDSISEMRNLGSTDVANNSNNNTLTGEQLTVHQIHTIQIQKIGDRDVIGCFGVDDFNPADPDNNQDIDPDVIIDPWKRDA